MAAETVEQTAPVMQGEVPDRRAESRSRSGRRRSSAVKRSRSGDVGGPVGPLGTTPNRNASWVDIRPGLLLIAPIGTTEPADIIDTAWPAAWIELGYTNDGSLFKVDSTLDEVEVAEEILPVAMVQSKQRATIEFAMAEITAWHLAVALGGGVITTGTGIVTFEPPAAGVQTEVMLGWRSDLKDEAILWRRCRVNGAINLERRTGNNKATLPVVFTVLVPTSGVKPWKFITTTAKTGPALTTIYP